MSCSAGPVLMPASEVVPWIIKVLALLLSSTLGLSESFRLEQETRAMEGLLLLPVEPVAIYLGKLIGNTLFLTLLIPVLAPVAQVAGTHWPATGPPTRGSCPGCTNPSAPAS